jgi:hypothetical protein
MEVIFSIKSKVLIGTPISVDHIKLRIEKRVITTIYMITMAEF